MLIARDAITGCGSWLHSAVMETCVRDDYSIPPSTTCQRLLATKHSALTLRSTLISPALLYFVTVDFSDIRSRWSTLLHTLFNDDEPNQSRMVIFDHFGSVTLGPIQLKLECVIVTHPTPHAKYGGHRKRGRVGTLKKFPSRVLLPFRQLLDARTANLRIVDFRSVHP